MALGDSGCDRVFGGLTSHKIGVVGWGWRQKNNWYSIAEYSNLQCFGLTVGCRQHIHASVGFRLKKRQTACVGKGFFSFADLHSQRQVPAVGLHLLVARSLRGLLKLLGVWIKEDRT